EDEDAFQIAGDPVTIGFRFLSVRLTGSTLRLAGNEFRSMMSVLSGSSISGKTSRPTMRRQWRL
ncbi:MAG: hypothetical protein AAFY42_10265, partial [Pseudomonadota bacterium]